MAAFSTYKPTVGLVDYPVKDAGLCDELDARFPGATSGWAAPGALGTGTRNTGAFSLVGIGAGVQTSMKAYLAGAGLIGTTQRGLYTDATGASDATAAVVGIGAQVATAAAAFTCAALSQFEAYDATKGAGSTITVQHGYVCQDLTVGATNYAFRGRVTSGAGKWNTFNDGTASNHFAGATRIGITAALIGAEQLSVYGGASEAGAFVNTANGTNALLVANRDTAGDNRFVSFYTEGSDTLRGSDDFNRASVLLRRNTTCDENLKHDLGPVPDVGPWLDEVASKIRLVEWRETGINAVTPLAQRLYPIAPFAVSPGHGQAGDHDYRPWGVDCTPFIPYLITEIASLRARVAQLEGA